jgi:hypothetical protein
LTNPHERGENYGPEIRPPAGPPMTLGNMRELGVQRLVASCLNDVVATSR